MEAILEQVSYYDIIYKRKSVRKYDLEPLSKNTLNDISVQTKKLTNLFPNIETEIKIVSSKDIKGLIQVKAPHYLVIFSEIKEGYLENAGFMLQQMDLYFSSSGIGSCWQGWPRPVVELRTNQNLEFVIALAFGTPKDVLYRNSISEFKRKPLDKIRIGFGFDDIIDAARIAPSPSQPWFFLVNGNTIYLYCSKTKGLWAGAFEKIKRIEMGVAICHMCCAAQHLNVGIEFIDEKNETIKSIAGYNYFISAKIS